MTPASSHVSAPRRRSALRHALLGACLLALCLAPTALTLATETLETMVIALQIKGRKPYQRLNIRDLDILQTGDSTRALPLRRMLSNAGLFSEEKGDTLFFRGARGEGYALSAATSMLRDSSGAHAIALTYGVSDITGQVDYYVPPALIDSVLQTELIWDEANYAYTGETPAAYPSWKDKGSKSRDKGELNNIKRLSVELPEVLPPAGPWALGDPAVHFIQPGITVNQNSADRRTMQKTLESHGRLAFGRYGFKLRQSSAQTNSNLTIDQFSLTHRMGDVETTLGDVEFGLSDLLFPTMSMTGVEANGLLGLRALDRDEDRSNFGKSDRYLPRTDYHGTAPLGSTVELYLGNRYIGEQKIIQPWGPAGEGLYRFEGVNLVRDRVNELKLIVTEPDGKVTERFEEVVGSSSLLQSGQSSFITGAGQRRFAAPDVWSTQGQFYGGRLLYGLAPFWTVGAAGAYQYHFAVPYAIDGADTMRTLASGTYPTWSSHAGFESKLRLQRRFILSLDAAASQSEYAARDSLPLRTENPGVDSSWALRAALDAHVANWLKLQPEVFHYSPGFFDGNNPLLQDREGYAAAARFIPQRGLVLNLVHGEVYNHLLTAETTRRHEIWDHADFNVPRIIPRTSMRVNLDQLGFRLPQGTAAMDRGPWQQGNISVNSTLLPFAEINGQVTVGDERHDSSVEDLRRGLALSGTTVTFRRQWNVAAGRALMKSGWITVGHNASAFRTRTELTHILRATGTSPWQWRLDAGWDWDAEDAYFQFQPEFYFERSGYSRITTLARYQDKSWLFAVGIQLQPIFSLVGGRPFVIPHSRLTPSSGGVKGIVFLDQNGNGTRDAREPGVKGIDVVADGGRRATSGKHGEFVLGGASLKRRMHVQLDGRTLSADYSATNGAQWANIEPGTLTQVTLGIVVPGSISGFVRGPDPRDSTQIIGVSGVRVVARDASGATKGESVSYMDGSFYVGGLLPGDYILEIDAATLSTGYNAVSASPPQQIRAGEGGHLDLADVVLALTFHRDAPPGEKRR